jgi:uncharacterized protein (TIGR00730 family)
MSAVPEDRMLERLRRHAELHFTRTNGAVDRAIESLMDSVGDFEHRDLVREMIIAALKAGQEGRSRADLKLMNTTLKEMRFTAKVFGPYRRVRKVTVFGSARTPESSPAYRMARELGASLAAAGFMVITGGGPGIMRAAVEGAGADQSFGVKIRLPFEPAAQDLFRDNPRLINYKYFFNRKVAFLKESDAVVLFPGGFGTLDEAMETLTLVQTGKHDPMPLILIEPEGEGYWTEVRAFFRDVLQAKGLVGAADLETLDYTNGVDEALAIVRRFYRRYHSARYVDGRLVLRLTAAPALPELHALRRDFADILLPGGAMALSGPLPAEADEPELARLPRLVLDFNRAAYARLYGLIRTLNRL